MACTGNTGRLGNVTLKKESTYGTYIAGDTQLRITDESLLRAIEHGEDAQLIGELYTSDMIKIADGAKGGINSSVHPDTIGIIMQGILGEEAIVSDPAEAYVIVNYVGSVAYARLTKSGTDLTAETSTDGSSWSVDAGFGTAGVIDLTDGATDTATELSAVIDGYTDYSSSVVGTGTSASSNIPDFSATNMKQAEERVSSIILAYKVSGSTTAKTHSLTPADSTACLPSYSFTVNRTLGTDKSVGIVGAKFSSIGITAGVKDIVKYSLNVVAQAEEGDKTDISLTIPTYEAFISPKITAWMNETKLTTLKDLSITINTNVDENNVIGSYEIEEPIRQNSTIETSFTANLNTVNYALRSNYTGDIPVEMLFYFENTNDADTVNNIPFSMLIRIPAVKLTDFNTTLSTPDRMQITGAGTAVKPLALADHIEVYIVDNLTSTY